VADDGRSPAVVKVRNSAGHDSEMREERGETNPTTRAVARVSADQGETT
jgi:hypothetical protein